MSSRANGGSPVRPKPGEVSVVRASIDGVNDMAAAAAALPGDDEEWEEFQRNLKKAAEARRAKMKEGADVEKKEVPADFEEKTAEEPEAGTRRPKKMADPKLPSELEIAEHEMTHLPFRSWCRHCVRGRGKELPHRKAEDLEGGVAEIHMDLCFPGEEDGSGGLTVLVAQDRETKMKLASAMPSKSTGNFIAKRILAFMREVGCEHGVVTIKSDQEPAMKAIVSEVGRLRAAAGGGRMTVEMSPVGQSQSNGIAERAIQSVEGQARVMKNALEDRLGVRLPAKHPIMPWLFEWSALVLNRYEVGKDGRTSYERCKGKKAKTLGLEFGESVLWKRKPSGGHLGKLTSLWEDGVYLGIKSGTGEIIVGNQKGVWKTRTVHRKPDKDRWNKLGVEILKGVPWRVSDEDDKADGENLDERIMLPKLEGEAMGDEEKDATEEFLKMSLPRQFRTSNEDYQEHGYTRGCLGCKALLGGKTKQKHSDHCRARMAEAMAGSKRVEGARERKRKFIEEALKAEESKKDKKAIGDADRGEGAKKSRLDEIEEEAMQTEDFEKLGELFTEYMEEEAKALKRANEESEGDARKRSKKEDAEGGASSMDIDVANLEINQEDEIEVDEWAPQEFWDQELDGEKVAEARTEEIQYMEGLGMFVPSSREECVAKTGKQPITTKWVDVNKGTSQEEIIRSRLVARDFKIKGEAARFDLFAAMPPLEAKRMLLQMAVRRSRDRPTRKYKLMFIDVKKAHLNGEIPEDVWVFVELPSEAGGGVVRLRRWLYGMRPAARAWEEHYAKKLIEAGFRRGVSNSTVFWHPEGDISLVVHGDDFTALGPEEELKNFKKQMKSWYEVKVRGVLGPGPLDDKEITILNRKLVWTKSGTITYEADPKNIESIVKAMDLQSDSKGLGAPIVTESAKEAEEEGEELNREEATRFRSIAALANYVALDRPDIQVAVSVLCQKMSRPTTKSMTALKRVARYLLDYPVLKFEYRGGDAGGEIELCVFADSDWAGCKETRKSRSGGLALLAGGPVKSWSNRQASPALSSGEAEYYAIVKAAAEALGIQALAADLGWQVRIRLKVDSSAAKAMASRSGIGKVRHLETKFLWVQDAVSRRRFTLQKVPGKINPADVLTKPMAQVLMRSLLSPWGFSFGPTRELRARVGGGVSGIRPPTYPQPVQ